MHSLQRRIELLKVTIQKSEKNFSARLEELSGYFGTTIKEGERLPASLTLTAPETPPAPAWVEQGGLALAPCGPTTVTLSRANFSLFGTAYVDIRYGLRR